MPMICQIDSFSTCSLDGLQHMADLMSAFALLFDLTISSPKLWAVCLGPSPSRVTLTMHGPGWIPTIIPVLSQGSVTILGLTIDLTPAQVTQPQSTRAHLIQAATILGHQREADTTALVASVSTLAKAAYTAQFVPGPPRVRRASQPGIPSPSPTPALSPECSPLPEPC